MMQSNIANDGRNAPIILETVFAQKPDPIITEINIIMLNTEKEEKVIISAHTIQDRKHNMLECSFLDFVIVMIKNLYKPYIFCLLRGTKK